MLLEDSASWACWPLPAAEDGRRPSISDGFHMRAGRDGVLGTADDVPHLGCDIMYRRKKAGPVTLPWQSKHYEILPGTQALAIGPGVVALAKRIRTGVQVTIDHGGGLESGYFHLSDLILKPGDLVQQGQPLGSVGWDMRPKGYRLSHLHFQLWTRGHKVIDPGPWLRRWTHVVQVPTPGAHEVPR